MPGVPAGAKLARMHIAFAFAAAPVTLGTLAVCALAGGHLISYWWLAFTLGWAVVPLAALFCALRCAREIQPAWPCHPPPRAQD